VSISSRKVDVAISLVDVEGPYTITFLNLQGWSDSRRESRIEGTGIPVPGYFTGVDIPRRGGA